MSYFPLNILTPYYINLNSRPDRRERIEKEIACAGLQSNRLQAFTKEQWPGSAEDVANMQDTPNTIGNWMSHTYLICTAHNSKRNVMVLEDDAVLCRDFQERLKYIADNLTWEWDILFLCGTFHLNPPVWHKDDIGRDVELTKHPNFLRAYGVFSNHGYVVNHKAGERIWGRMKDIMHTCKGSDHALIKLQPELKAYVFVPGMVFQRDEQSDIGHGITKFSEFRKLGPYVYTDYMKEFDPRKFDWKEART